MTEVALWRNPLYVQTVTSVVLFFLVVGAWVFVVQTRNPKWTAVWMSIKSWVLTSPILFLFAALPSPWPLVFVGAVAISGAKTFFRMTGMYHRSWYVWITYIFIGLQGYLVFRQYDRFFNIMPMLFFAAIALVPILRNSATQMIQYMALTLMNFIFMGWGFLHFGRILELPGGALIALYLVILLEFCEASFFAITRAWGKHKPLDNISTRFSVEGFIGSIFFTLLMAWALRHMLPDRSEIYWVSAGICVSVLGRFGAILLSVIRRDIGVKESGIFIIGRDDILARIDKAMFAAPAFYFIYLFILGQISL